MVRQRASGGGGVLGCLASLGTRRLLGGACIAALYYYTMYYTPPVDDGSKRRAIAAKAAAAEEAFERERRKRMKETLTPAEAAAALRTTFRSAVVEGNMTHLKFALMEVLNGEVEEEAATSRVGEAGEEHKRNPHCGGEGGGGGGYTSTSGSGINQRLSDEDGRTALHLCSMLGHLECVQFLLENGAAVNVVDNGGATPFNLAVGANHTAAAQLLVNSTIGLLVPGTEVEVTGLTSATALNGQRGVVIAPAAAVRGSGIGPGRVQVQLAGHLAPKAIRPENLVRVGDL